MSLREQTEKFLPKMFIAGAIFGALSCFARADYNLPLYAFLYLMWDANPDNNKLVRVSDPPVAALNGSDLSLNLLGRQAQITWSPRLQLDLRPHLDDVLLAPLE